MTPSPKTRGAPPPRLKNHSELGKHGLFFLFFVWGTAGIARRRHFSLWGCSPDAEVKMYVSFFENSFRGPSIVAVILGVQSPAAKKAKMAV